MAVAAIYAVKYRYEFQAAIAQVEGGFSKVSGLSESINVQEWRDGDDPFLMKKVPDVRSGGDVVLSKGIIKNGSALFEWFKKAKGFNGQRFRENPSIQVQDCAAKEMKNFRVLNAWPREYKVDDLDAESSGVLLESLTLATEGIETF